MGSKKQKLEKQEKKKIKNNQNPQQQGSQQDAGFSLFSFKTFIKFFLFPMFLLGSQFYDDLLALVGFGGSGDYIIENTDDSEYDNIKYLHPHIGKYTKIVDNQKNDTYFEQESENTKEVLHYLHLFSNVTFEKQHFDTKYSYEWGHLGIKNDYQYCEKSDYLKLLQPEIVLDNYYFYVDFQQKSLPRELTRAYGIDATPFASVGMSQIKQNNKIYDLSPKISLINSQKSRVHHFHPFTTCLFCLFQTSNHIPGKWAITGKDYVINNLRKYEKQNFQDSKQCLDSIKFMPKSYRLFNKQECLEFFEFIQTQEYKDILKNNGLGFIMKEGSDIHRGNGIEIFTPDVQDRYQQQYQNGEKCGINKKIVQSQTYIANPMLYKGNKIEVRIYFLIASTDPLIVYSQDNAHLRMCSIPFDKWSLKKEVHVCNVAVSKNTSNKDYVVDFSLEGLRDYLLEEKMIDNKNWVEEIVYPQVYQAISHIARMGKGKYLKDSRVNENFAIDFLLDDQSNLWFLENNPNPQIMRTSSERVKRHYKMFGDLFEIQYNYLRARFTRIRNFSKQMVKNISDVRQNPMKWQQEFKKINQNYIDQPQFEIRAENSYRKIYDETLQGTAKFMGNLPDGCEIIN